MDSGSPSARRETICWPGRSATRPIDLEVCPFYSCAAETGVPNCGRCPDFPCELYSLSFPEEAPDEEFDRYIDNRYANFALIDPKI